MSNPSSMLDVAEVAERTGLSKKTVRGAIERGELVGYLLCNRMRVAEEDFDAWLAASRVAPRGPTPRPGPAHSPAPNGLRRLLTLDQEGADR
jgi:excisionase family DNA binding protein